MAKLNTKQRAQRAGAAADALLLSALTNADKTRCYQVQDGLRALDDEQADLKARLAELCEEYWNPNAPEDDCAHLIRKLNTLLVPLRGWRERAGQRQSAERSGK